MTTVGYSSDERSERAASVAYAVRAARLRRHLNRTLADLGAIEERTPDENLRFLLASVHRQRLRDAANPWLLLAHGSGMGNGRQDGSLRRNDRTYCAPTSERAREEREHVDEQAVAVPVPDDIASAAASDELSLRDGDRRRRDVERLIRDLVLSVSRLSSATFCYYDNNYAGPAGRLLADGIWFSHDYCRRPGEWDAIRSAGGHHVNAAPRLRPVGGRRSQAAHGAGLVHRHLKPENILVEPAATS